MNKQELLLKLNGSEELIGSALVPVSEVIKWVMALEESNIDLVELEEQLMSEIMGEDLELISDYELSMSYKEVELESVDLNESTLRNAIQRAIEEVTIK
jgi:hypothetical protein